MEEKHEMLYQREIRRKIIREQNDTRLAEKRQG